MSSKKNSDRIIYPHSFNEVRNLNVTHEYNNSPTAVSYSYQNNRMNNASQSNENLENSQRIYTDQNDGSCYARRSNELVSPSFRTEFKFSPSSSTNTDCFRNFRDRRPCNNSPTFRTCQNAPVYEAEYLPSTSDNFESGDTTFLNHSNNIQIFGTEYFLQKQQFLAKKAETLKMAVDNVRDEEALAKLKIYDAINKQEQALNLAEQSLKLRKRLVNEKLRAASAIMQNATDLFLENQSEMCHEENLEDLDCKTFIKKEVDQTNACNKDIKMSSYSSSLPQEDFANMKRYYDDNSDEHIAIRSSKKPPRTYSRKTRNHSKRVSNFSHEIAKREVTPYENCDSLILKNTSGSVTVEMKPKLLSKSIISPLHNIADRNSIQVINSKNETVTISKIVKSNKYNNDNKYRIPEKLKNLNTAKMKPKVAQNLKQRQIKHLFQDKPVAKLLQFFKPIKIKKEFENDFMEEKQKRNVSLTSNVNTSTVKYLAEENLSNKDNERFILDSKGINEKFHSNVSRKRSRTDLIDTPLNFKPALIVDKRLENESYSNDDEEPFQVIWHNIHPEIQSQSKFMSTFPISCDQQKSSTPLFYDINPARIINEECANENSSEHSNFLKNKETNSCEKAMSDISSETIANVISDDYEENLNDEIDSVLSIEFETDCSLQTNKFTDNAKFDQQLNEIPEFNQSCNYNLDKSISLNQSDKQEWKHEYLKLHEINNHKFNKSSELSKELDEPLQFRNASNVHELHRNFASHQNTQYLVDHSEYNQSNNQECNKLSPFDKLVVKQTVIPEKGLVQSHDNFMEIQENVNSITQHTEKTSNLVDNSDTLVGISGNFHEPQAPLNLTNLNKSQTVNKMLEFKKTDDSEALKKYLESLEQEGTTMKYIEDLTKRCSGRSVENLNQSNDFDLSLNIESEKGNENFKQDRRQELSRFINDEAEVMSNFSDKDAFLESMERSKIDSELNNNKNLNTNSQNKLDIDVSICSIEISTKINYPNIEKLENKDCDVNAPSNFNVPVIAHDLLINDEQNNSFKRKRHSSTTFSRKDEIITEKKSSVVTDHNLLSDDEQNNSLKRKRRRKAKSTIAKEEFLDKNNHSSTIFSHQDEIITEKKCSTDAYIPVSDIRVEQKFTNAKLFERKSYELPVKGENTGVFSDSEKENIIKQTKTTTTVGTRKRGRKPKLASSKSCSENFGEENTAVFSDSEKENIIKQTKTTTTVGTRKRGRKPKLASSKSCSENFGEENTGVFSDSKKENVIKQTKTTSTVGTRKRGRKPKFTSSKSCFENFEEGNTGVFSDSEKENKIKQTKTITTEGTRKRGRKPKLTSFRSRPKTFEDTIFSETDEDDLEDNMQCGKCDACFANVHELRKHIVYNHMGLARRKGRSQEFNKDKLRFITTSLLKKLKKLTCENCSKKYASFLGFEMHIEHCGKPANEIFEICQICSKSILKPHFMIHMRQHKYSEQKSLNLKTKKDETPLPIYENGKRVKRKAAKKCNENLTKFVNDQNFKNKVDVNPDTRTKEENTSKISEENSKQLCQKLKSFNVNNELLCINLNCGFNSSSVQEWLTHLKVCNDNFVCRICNITPKSKNLIKHISLKHLDKYVESDLDGEYSYNNEEEDDESEYTSSEEDEVKVVKRTSHSRQPFCKFQEKGQIAEEFIKRNYSDSLFDDLECDLKTWSNLSIESLQDYIPCIKKSPSFTFDSNNSWDTLNVFDAMNLDPHEKLIFSGGPILCCAWCPSYPINNDSVQYLALAAKTDPDKEIFLQESHKNKALIQFWEIDTKKHCTKFSFGICHELGEALSMVWCPSGAYVDLKQNSTNNRLGILAVAFSTGIVGVYAVPHPQQFAASSSNTKFYLKCSDISLVTSDSEHLSCLKVDWSHAKGHNLIAGAFSNGIVSIWNLEDRKITIEKSKEFGLKLYPRYVILAHSTACTEVKFFSDFDQYIITAGSDRFVKFWSIHNPEEPISMVIKSFVTNLNWLPEWTGAFICRDSNHMHKNFSISFLDNGFFDHFGTKGINCLDGATWATSTCIWENSIVQINDAGHILVNTFPSSNFLPTYSRDEFIAATELQDLNTQTTLSYEGICDSTCCVLTDKTSDYIACPKHPVTYKLMSQKYGLKIGKLRYKKNLRRLMAKKTKNRSIISTHLKNELGPIHNFPMAGALSVSWNNNREARKWIFVGTMSGLGRFIKVE